MARYRLISFRTCPWVQRAAIVLREKGVAFEFDHIEPGNRPDWFGAISPHGKVPVLRIDDDVALFESNAIAEYLDEAVGPRLHPADPVVRAINRAWTDYLPGFAALAGAVGGASSEEALADARVTLDPAFARIEDALKKQGAGPYFNGAAYALVDAAYAPFLQRYLIVAGIIGDDFGSRFPRVHGWAEALVARASTHSFPPDVFRPLYLDALARRGSIVAKQALAA